MTVLYNCKHAGDQYRMTKFDAQMNVEASYLCTATECECPAGVRDNCRHRTMLHRFLARDHVGDNWFHDFDRNGWVQMETIVEFTPDLECATGVNNSQGLAVSEPDAAPPVAHSRPFSRRGL